MSGVAISFLLIACTEGTNAYPVVIVVAVIGVVGCKQNAARKKSNGLYHSNLQWSQWSRVCFPWTKAAWLYILLSDVQEFSMYLNITVCVYIYIYICITMYAYKNHIESHNWVYSIQDLPTVCHVNVSVWWCLQTFSLLVDKQNWTI